MNAIAEPDGQWSELEDRPAKVMQVFGDFCRLLSTLTTSTVP